MDLPPTDLYELGQACHDLPGMCNFGGGIMLPKTVNTNLPYSVGTRFDIRVGHQLAGLYG